MTTFQEMGLTSQETVNYNRQSAKRSIYPYLNVLNKMIENLSNIVTASEYGTKNIFFIL